jgi:hypothetical protein
MEPVTFGRATNRRVLGSINDLAFQASMHLARRDDLLTISRRLADTLMSAIGAKPGGYGYPGGGCARTPHHERGSNTPPEQLTACSAH